MAKVNYDEDKIRFYAETMNGSYRLTVPAKYFNMSDKEIIKDADLIISTEIQYHLDLIKTNAKTKAEEDYRTYLELKRRFEGK